MKAPILSMELCPHEHHLVELVSIHESGGGESPLHLLPDIFQPRKLMHGAIKKLSLEHR